MKNKHLLTIEITCATSVLLAVMLGVVFYFSHVALRDEAVHYAEQTLENTVLDIDNVLLSVEQATGNIYYDMLEHLDDPQRMFTYSKALVECNPYISGCAIAFKPGFFPGHDRFMAYTHYRGYSTHGDMSELVTSETFSKRPYTEHEWYTEPMETGWIGWTDPLKEEEDEGVTISFCLPFSNKADERIGVMVVDVAVSQLSKIILAAKLTENGYAVLLSHNGSYIVHPDPEVVTSLTAFAQDTENADHRLMEAIEAMRAGEAGSKTYLKDGREWRVFYKPFQIEEWEGRSKAVADWSVGVIYPEDDIHSVHNKLLYLVISIAILGMLLFFLMTRWVLRRELKPMRRLTALAQRIADGHLDEPVPDMNRNDEIGLLRDRLKKMLRTKLEQIDKLKSERNALRGRTEVLGNNYGKTLEADRMKTSFLHYMTTQMTAPTESIEQSVTTLCNDYQGNSQQEIDKQVDNIQRKSETLLDLLNHMAHFTKPETGKEGDHE